MASAGKGKASKMAVWVILGLLIVGLAGFGTTHFGSSTQAVATVGSRDVTVHDYARALQQDLNALQAQFGQSIPLSQAQHFGLDAQALQRLIATAALDSETERLGLSVGDARVREQVLDMQNFQGLDGEFDRETYRAALRHGGLSEGEFEDSIRIETARTLLQGAVLGGIAAPEGFTDALLAYVGETRDFTWAELTEGDLITGVPVPSDADLAAFHAANEADYTLPEAKAITYAWLTPDMILDEIDVNEDVLREAYDDRADEFNRPERRLVERLVFSNEASAAAALQQIVAEEVTFDGLVETRGLNLSDIDLGDVTEGELGDAGAAVFALTEPGLTGPHPSPLGPALFRVNAILAPESTTYEEARPDLLAEFASDQARRSIADEISAIDDLLAGGATLEELAGETPMVLGSIEWSDDSEGDIAAYEAFRAAAAQVTQDDFPEVNELDDGGIFAIRLNDIVPPRLQPLADIRDKVAADWQAAETAMRLAELARSMVDQITPETDLASFGLIARIEEGLTRDAFIEATPVELLIEVFEMAPGEVRVIESEATALLFRLDAIHAPDTEDPETAILERAIQSQTAQSMAQDMFDAYSRAVQTEAGISINQAAINAVHAQFP